MNCIRCAISRSVIVMAALLAFTPHLFAQTNDVSDADTPARGGAGLRVGVWNVNEPGTPGTTYVQTPHAQVYFQRGLDEHIALESSIGVWRRTATRIELSGNEVETHTYIFPLFTALRVYALTTLENRIEPFITGGIGFALGIDDVGENAIGGGGTTIVTGFGFQGGAGLDVHITNTFGVQASARYTWLNFGEPLGGSELYKGFGFEGGITYRLPM
jgi:opacity protein-like surface antigen